MPLFLFYQNDKQRISKVLNLRKESIDLNEKMVVIESLKKRRKGVFRQIPICPTFVKQLKMLVTKLDSQARIWPFSRRTATRYIKRVMESAGINGPQACPKGLRHSFAIHCLINNVPITIIKKWLGHSSLVTTSIYLEVANEEEKEIAKKIW